MPFFGLSVTYKLKLVQITLLASYILQRIIITRLEGITNGQLQTLAILKFTHIIESALVWHVNTNTPVNTNNKEIEVVAQPNTCS